MNQPNYSNINIDTYEWSKSVYGNVKESMPEDAPQPLGNPVTLTTYVDANLYHNLLTERSVSGIIHLINKTPFDWYSKK